jgi:hypothetical protein
MKHGLAVMLFVSMVAAGQTMPAPSQPLPQQAVYRNAELHLTFSYPADLAPRDAAAVAAVGRRMIYGADAETDPAHSKADACMKVLLSVGKNSAGTQPGAQASLTLFDVDMRCLPAKALKNKKTMDGALTGLATQGTTVLGMMPIEEPMHYEIQGHRVRLVAAQGTPVSKTDLQTDGAQLIAVAATAVNGHVLSWVFEANDLATFNQMLASQVDFGVGKPQPLFPAGFQ